MAAEVSTINFPLAVAHRALRSAGTERVSSDAAPVLKEATLDYMAALSKKAAELAAHAGRKTIRAEDVSLAIKSV